MSGTTADVNDRGERLARGVARLGLGARTAFYLLLVGLVIEVAVEHGRSGRQANAHGALALVANNPVGAAAVVATAGGFFVFGALRVVGAARDGQAEWWQRLTTGLQGLFYVALAWVPLEFVLGRRQVGSEQSQHDETATVLHWPLGREIVAGAGVVLVCVCAWQIRSALTRSFDDGLQLSGQPPWVRRLVSIVGAVGIAARALVFVPIGVFLVLAAVQSDPRRADGLDAALARVARHAWGPAVLGVVALGLLAFACYSGVEARFRDLEAAS